MLSVKHTVFMSFFAMLTVAISACAPKPAPVPKPIPNIPKPMPKPKPTLKPPQRIAVAGLTELDDGIPILGHNLLTAISRKKALVLVEPFKEASLYDEIASSATIEKLLLHVGDRKKFSRIHLVSTSDASDEQLDNADYIIKGVISYQAYPKKGSRKYYKISAALANRKTGRPKAHEDIWVYSVSYGPQELPVISSDPKAKRKIAEVINEQRITVSDIALDARITKIKNAYRSRKYKTARKILLQLLQSRQGGNLDVYRMLYLTHLKLANYHAAEATFFNMITVGFKNSNTMPLIFLFNSDETEFDSNRSREYGIWTRQLIAYLIRNTKKCMHIIGHTSKQGDFDYNMKLSLNRAEYIKNRLIQESASISGKITVEGKGETATKDGSEPDSDQNMIDRRVEFELFNCEK